MISYSGDADRYRRLGYGVAGIPGRRSIAITGASIDIKGTLTDAGVKYFMSARTSCHCPEDMELHATNCPNFPGQPMGNEEEHMTEETSRDIAQTFLEEMNLTATPDAISQLIEVFVPCLRIMCERGYASDGSTWQEAGRMGILCDVRKKFTRLWRDGWTLRRIVRDHALDLINYVGFYLRANDPGWAEWGEPGTVEIGKEGS
jgi:hypothetical protein